MHYSLQQARCCHLLHSTQQGGMQPAFEAQLHVQP